MRAAWVLSCTPWLRLRQHWQPSAGHRTLLDSILPAHPPHAAPKSGSGSSWLWPEATLPAGAGAAPPTARCPQPAARHPAASRIWLVWQRICLRPSLWAQPTGCGLGPSAGRSWCAAPSALQCRAVSNSRRPAAPRPLRARRGGAQIPTQPLGGRGAVGAGGGTTTAVDGRETRRIQGT